MSTDQQSQQIRPQSQQPRPTYRDHQVTDEHGVKLGTVTDVVYNLSADEPDTETADAAPEWLVVDPGVLRSAHYVPVAGSYRTEDDDIVVPWTADWIKSAPKATKDHVVTHEIVAELRNHYAKVSDTPTV